MQKKQENLASNKTNINGIAICKAMLILCILSTYIVAVLRSFQKIWLQLDDNWLKSFAFYDSLTFESWQGVVHFSDSIFSLHGEINWFYWPWCKPTGVTFQTNYSLPRWFACGVSFTIFPDYLMIYTLIECTGAYQSNMRTIPLQWLNMPETEKNWNDSLRTTGKREVLSVKTCFVCRIFFSLLSLEGRGAVDEFLSRSRW